VISASNKYVTSFACKT